MDSARPGGPQKLLTIKEAAERLAVSIDTLLMWNEYHILKPTITSEGEIGYTEEQLSQFTKIQQTLPSSQLNQQIISETPENQPGRVDLEGIPSPTSQVREARPGLYGKFIHWVGDGRYQEH